MPTHQEDPLSQLAVVDPNLAASVAASLAQKEPAVSRSEKMILVAEILWGLSIEISFGTAVAEGYLSLLGSVEPAALVRYRQEVRQAGKNGPTMGRIMATHLPPVLKTADPALTHRFFETIAILTGKGRHLLDGPLKCLVRLLSTGGVDAGDGFLALLTVVFSTDVTYNRARALARELPAAIDRLSPAKRNWQIRALCRTAGVATELLDPFLAGMEKGLHLLSEKALNRFVSESIAKYKIKKSLGKAFLSLDSQLAIQTHNALQVSVPIFQVQQPINRYLKARTGCNLTIKPLSALPTTAFKDEPVPMVCSDGRFVYLPDEISRFDTQALNRTLYKVLAKLESGYYEFGTFDFDMEKLAARCPKWRSTPVMMEDLSDMERFFQTFSRPELARDLFSIFESGRLRILMSAHYPGLVRQALPILVHEIRKQHQSGTGPDTGIALTVEIILGSGNASACGIATRTNNRVRPLAERFEASIQANPVVETCAELVTACYPEVRRNFPSLMAPFGRRVRPDLVRLAHRGTEQLATRIKSRLDAADVRIYRSEIRAHLVQNNGRISSADLLAMIDHKGPNPASPPASDSQLTTILNSIVTETVGHNEPEAPVADATGPVFWYPEWSHPVADYLNDHVRVVEREIVGGSEQAYQCIVNTHEALIKKIRHAFELLKPEGLALLRHWTDGDEFDYRALIDAAIDRRTGRIPTDRLYTKRLKQQRDVAVMLLVDLSRSTANTVAGTDKTILDVEREAIVLFCQALQVVGDTYAISGFSGTGRLGVDYWPVKKFHEPLGESVRRRICAMAPQRNTRMGAAIRHAAACLECVPAKIRLLISLGDGFPNDTGYKGLTATADTQKAIAEARAKGITVRPITVNLAANSQLDRMYGNLHHQVISDVRELPDKLWRFYSALTR